MQLALLLVLLSPAACSPQTYSLSIGVGGDASPPQVLVHSAPPQDIVHSAPPQVLVHPHQQVLKNPHFKQQRKFPKDDATKCCV